jgi:hypothetical protein
MSWVEKIPYESNSNKLNLLETTIEYIPIEVKYIEYEDKLHREYYKESEFMPYRTKYSS